MIIGLYGCFCKLGVPFVDVLIMRVLLFGVHIGAPAFWNLPCRAQGHGLT